MSLDGKTRIINGIKTVAQGFEEITAPEKLDSNDWRVLMAILKLFKEKLPKIRKTKYKRRNGDEYDVKVESITVKMADIAKYAGWPTSKYYYDIIASSLRRMGHLEYFINARYFDEETNEIVLREMKIYSFISMERAHGTKKSEKADLIEIGIHPRFYDVLMAQSDAFFTGVSWEEYKRLTRKGGNSISPTALLLYYKLCTWIWPKSQPGTKISKDGFKQGIYSFSRVGRWLWGIDIDSLASQQKYDKYRDIRKYARELNDALMEFGTWHIESIKNEHGESFLKVERKVKNVRRKRKPS